MLHNKKFFRRVALLLCLSMIVGLVPAGLLGASIRVNAVPETAEPANTNLIVNGTFDDDTSGWSGASVGKTDVIDNVMQVTANKSPVCLNQVFEVTAGEKYTLTLRVKREAGDKNPYAGLWFFKDTAANANCIDVAKVDITDQSNTWIEVKVSAVVPEGANLVQVQLGNNSALTGTYWLDDVTLTKSQLTVVFSDNFTNYAVEGSAGSGPKNWTLSETDTGNHTNITCYNYTQYGGKPAMTLQTKAATAETPTFDVAPGTVYTAEFATYLLGSKDGGYVEFAFTDAQGVVLTSVRQAVAAKAEWAEDSVSAVAPDGAAKGYLVFGITQNGDDFGVASLVVSASGYVDVEPTKPTEATEPAGSVDGNVVFADDFETHDNYDYTNSAGSIVQKGLPKDWVMENPTSLAIMVSNTASWGANGSYMLFFQENRNQSIESPRFDVSPGYTYTAVFEQMKLYEGPGGYAAIYFVDAQGNVLSSKTVDIYNNPNLKEWTQNQVSAAAPANAVKAYVEFGVTDAATKMTYFGVDNLVVTAVAGSVPDPEPTEGTEATEPTEGTEPITGDAVFSDDFTVYAVAGESGSGPKNWILSETDNGSNSNITSRPYFDRPSLTLQSKPATAQTPAFNVVSGMAYIVTFDGYKHIVGEQVGGYVELTFVDASGNVLATKKQAAGLTGKAWGAEFMGEIAPAGAVQAYVTFGITANADSFSVSNLVVLESTEVPEPTTPPETEPLPTDPPEANDALLNGDFESSASELIGWVPSKGSAVPEIIPGEGIDGSNALKFTNVNRLTELSSELFAIEGGKIYDLTVWTRLDASVEPSTRFNMFVHWYNAGGVEIKQDGAGAINSTNEWTKFVANIAAPEKAAYAVIRFYVSGNNCTLVSFVDNVSLTLSDFTPVDPTVLEVINGSFEKGMANWKGGSSEGATNEIVTDGAFSGQSILITANATDTARAVTSFAQTLYLNGATALHLTAMSRTLNIESIRGSYIGLWFYDADGKLVPENTAFSVPIGTTVGWNESSLIQAVPEGAVTVKVEFGNQSGQVGLAYMIDDISVVLYDGPAENIRPATPAEPSTPSGSGGVLVDPSELNGSLEVLDAYGMPLGWRLLGNAVKYTVLQLDDAPDGKNVIQMVKTGQGGNSMRSPRIACVPGETYELKVMVKNIVGSAIVGLYVYDADGKRLDTACRTVNSIGVDKWQMYTILGTMPDNAAGIELEVWGAANSTYTVQVDKLRIQVSEIKTKAPYVPTPYEYPTVEELTANLTDVYPRAFFTPEEAKEIKLRRFDTLKTKYGWSWNEQYTTLLESADASIDVEELRVRSNTGEQITMEFLKDVNDPDNRALYLANSYDENGNLYEYPYTGFGALVTSQYATMMKNWSLSYIMTGKAIYAQKAIDMAMTIASWEGWTDEYWVEGHGVYADASHAWMMEGMVAVFDMCHDRMTEEQIKTLERNIIDEGLVPLSKQVDPNSTGNGNMMMVGGILSGAAVILNEENAAEVKQYLDVGLLCLHNALDNYAYSGNTEGHYYTDFGLQTFMPGVGHLYRATKMDGIIDHEFFTEILPYWTIMWGANGTGSHPNYSDGSVAAYMQLPMGVLSKLTDNSLIDGFLINAGGIGGAYNNLIYLKPDPQPTYLSDYAGVIEEYGYGALRTGFADDDMLLVLKANDSQQGHNHYDQNSIQFSVGHSWLITDPGAGSYYYADRSFWTHNGHSTILVDGNAQMIRGLSSTELIFNNNLYSYIMGSAANAYGSDYDSQMLEKFERHAIQVNHEDKGYYVIIDDLLSSKDREYSWQMYNGSRGKFSVDDVEVPSETIAMGNKVSVPMGKNVLNLNFVDSEQLAIGDRAYTGGLCLTATSAATKAHQFMTIISTDSNILTFDINFSDIANGLRSTVPEHIVEGEISWDSSMPLGQEIIKPNTTGTTPTIFYRGNGIGDWLEVPFTVDNAGTYDFDLIMGVSDGCCQIQATLDGKYVSDIVDCSGLPEGLIEVPFGEIELEAGTHTIRMEIVGKGLDEDYADGWYLINAAGVSMLRVGVEIPPAEDLIVTEVIDNEQALAGMINYKDNKFDFLMWNRTAGAATAGLLNTDGQQASVLGLVDGVITEGFAATGATTMTYDGKVLFYADKKVNIVASNTGWQIIADEATNVKLTAILPELDYVVTVNGETVDAKIESGALTLDVAAGETHIAVVTEQVEEPDPTDPTEPDETTPTETTPAESTEKTQAAGLPLWLTLAIILVVLEGAAIAFTVIRKKRNA